MMPLRTTKRLEVVLHEGEVFGLIFTAVMLIIVEACFVYWLNHIQLPDYSVAQSGFLVVPPWHRKPRFEVSLLLTIAAGMVFSVIRGLWELWRSSEGNADLMKRLRQRLSAAASVTAIAGVNLALATWLAR
jgi:uncharacterized membrane protein